MIAAAVVALAAGNAAAQGTQPYTCLFEGDIAPAEVQGPNGPATGFSGSLPATCAAAEGGPVVTGDVAVEGFMACSGAVVTMGRLSTPVSPATEHEFTITGLGDDFGSGWSSDDQDTAAGALTLNDGSGGGPVLFTDLVCGDLFAGTGNAPASGHVRGSITL